MWADAVFEGGGVKAIGLVGALTVAEQRGYRWKRVAGTSAGAIIAALLSAGYRADELKKMLERLDYRQFVAPAGWYRLRRIGPLARLWWKKGLYSGKKIETWMESLLLQKGIRTFADLTDGRLQIVASDITRGRLLVLPKDLPLYGLSSADVTVARAVRMSCSIPYFFDPVILVSRNEPRRNYVVDGSVLSNFPVWLFDQQSPRWPTFGFRLVSKENTDPHDIRGPLSLFRALFHTMMEAHDTRYLEEHNRVRTIFVPSLGVKTTDFNISAEKSNALFHSGVQQAEKFFQQWDFEQYVQIYRKRKSFTVTINEKSL